MKVCPKCGTYMQISTTGEYCPNGCGWNERINNYRIIPIASDHTEPSKELLPCPFCGKELHRYEEDGEWVIECLTRGCLMISGPLCKKDAMERMLEVKE